MDYGKLYKEGEDKELDDLRQDGDLVDLLDWVIDKVGGYSASYLSDWSHSAGSPWEKATQNPHFKWGNEMDDGIIKEYFSELLQNRENS